MYKLDSLKYTPLFGGANQNIVSPSHLVQLPNKYSEVKHRCYLIDKNNEIYRSIKVFNNASVLLDREEPELVEYLSDKSKTFSDYDLFTLNKKFNSYIKSFYDYSTEDHEYVLTGIADMNKHKMVFYSNGTFEMERNEIEYNYCDESLMFISQSGSNAFSYINIQDVPKYLIPQKVPYKSFVEFSQCDISPISAIHDVVGDRVARLVGVLLLIKTQKFTESNYKYCALMFERPIITGSQLQINGATKVLENGKYTLRITMRNPLGGFSSSLKVVDIYDILNIARYNYPTIELSEPNYKYSE